MSNLLVTVHSHSLPVQQKESEAIYIQNKIRLRYCERDRVIPTVDGLLPIFSPLSLLRAQPKTKPKSNASLSLLYSPPRRTARPQSAEGSKEESRIALAMPCQQEFIMANNPNLNLLAAPVKSPVDKFQLLPAFLKVRGLVKQHIDSFNYFLNHGIKQIMHANSLHTVTDTIYLRYFNISVGDPYLPIENNKLTPQFCRLSDTTYSADISVDIEYTDGKGQLPTRKTGVKIGRLPIMLRSCNCVLNGKDETELSKLGECPLDPGGYFVVKGTEKVILIQEQLSKNRIIIDIDRKGRVAASVTCSTHKVKSKTTFYMDKGKIYLDLNQFKPIPIMVVMKAMGIESDQEVVQMVGRDPRYADLLLPSIEECSSERIYSQEQALDYMDANAKVAYGGSMNSEKRREGRAKSILTDVFLAHVPVKEGNFRPKCIYSAVMLRRMLDAVLNADTVDDKDYVGNKRLELSGQLVSLLFEDLFKTMNSQAVARMKNTMGQSNRSGALDFSRYIVTDIITLGLEKAISTGNWDLRRFNMHRKGVSQVLSRLSYIGALGHMTRISPQFEKTRKVSGPRALQPSQWGMLCPCDTPEGEACGLTKNLSLMTHVTTDEEEGPLISLCYSLGVEDLAHLSGEEIHAKDSYLVFFNGLILGKHTRPHTFANAMRRLRRSGKIGEFVSIFVHEKQNCVYVASDGGRVCRPLIIADKGISRVKEHHLKELQVGFRTFDDFLHDGLIEYLDVNEQNNALIALYEHEVGREDIDRSAITHIEIEPLTLLGVVAGLIPYPHHNQSPRNTYQCAMGKQAMGNIAYNQLCRADTLLYLLVYAQRPLLTTKTIELVGYDKLGAGQNATVAVMSYSGYDIEDAIVMNKSSLDRGFGRCIAMKKQTVVKDNYGGKVSDIILSPQRDKDGALVKKNMQILDADGIAAPGQIVRNNDMLVNKRSPVNLDKDGRFRDTSAFFKGVEGETTVIDRVILYKDNNEKMPIKFIIRHTRRPELGDKFSSRHGQKGVCGTIVQQEDFPFSERGICPDLIMNPHGFPSRMTIGKMIELLGGKAGVSWGRFHYGSAFGEPSGNADKVEDISNALIGRGFSYNGKDFLYSGILGIPLQAYIFMGPIYYQKLKHMVLDKMHARAKGPRVLLTRQPTEGRSRDGGLRLGEMERDCLIAYGASMLIFERLMLSSDPYQVQVCEECGLLGYYNKKLKKSFCSMCKNGENMATMKLPYACKLLFQELQSMNVVPRLKLADV
ncbi:DNA-directed RNA polymerase subunit beta [Rhynchospora pubera]|uniref:DNA-directed RNA polymerase subunit beta n=1 Tax=Rhynchospora pubera TaxID=906938 RepID=A0AAV8EMU0_9POAL|nr:DNA-directed RNA polymerase subunit beta [Rhynchospora pubera]